MISLNIIFIQKNLATDKMIILGVTVAHRYENKNIRKKSKQTDVNFGRKSFFTPDQTLNSRVDHVTHISDI